MTQINDAAKKFYIVMFLFFLPFGIYWPIWQVNFLSQGLSQEQIAILVMVIGMSRMLTVLPAGIVGDMLGRKLTCILSALLLFAGFSVFSVFATYQALIFGTVLVSLGEAFSTGVLTSWIYESVKAKLGDLDHNSSNKLFASSDLYQRTGIVVGALLGGYLAYLNIRLPWQLAALVYLFLFIYLFTRTEETCIQNETSNINSLNKIINQLKTIYHDLLAQKPLLWISLAVFIWGLGDSIGQTYFFPYMKTLSGKAVWILGYIQIAISLSRILGNLLLIKKMNFKNSSTHTKTALMMFLNGLMFLALGFVANFYLALLLMMIRIVFFALFNSFYNTTINKIILQRSRASLLSFFSMLYYFSMSIGALMLSKFGGAFNIRLLWMLAGLVLFMSSLIFLRSHNGANRQNNN